jgi:hypothetical protein
VARPQPLDPLHRLLLRAVEATSPATLDRLDARLGLGRAPLFQWLHDLGDAGLLRAAGDAYALTAAGPEALAAGTYTRPGRERRRFTFVDVPGGTPHFLPWRRPAGAPGPVGAADVRLVAECVNRSADWKQTYGFPEDVLGVDTPDPALPAAEAWRRVVVVQTERVMVALAVVAPEGGTERLVGFAIVGDNLVVNEPALELGAGWEAPFPELAAAESRGPDAAGGWQLVGEGRLRRVVEL